MSAIRPRISCATCHVTRRVDTVFQLCDTCAADARSLARVVALILEKYPKMGYYSTPELFLRLWRAYPPVAKDADALAKADALSDALAAAIINEPLKEGTTPEGVAAHEAFKEERKKA